MSTKRLFLGKKGENLASVFLKKKGYKIVCTNYRTRLGEIDIIAKEKNCLIFIEVKTRKSTFLESPFSAVTTQKQRQISRVAVEYLSKTNNHDAEARFDVIGVTVDKSGKPHVEHLQSAFDLLY